MTNGQQHLVFIYNVGTILSFCLFFAIVIFFLTGRTLFSLFWGSANLTQMDLEATGGIQTSTETWNTFRELFGEQVYIPSISLPGGNPTICVDVDQNVCKVPTKFLGFAAVQLADSNLKVVHVVHNNNVGVDSVDSVDFHTCHAFVY